MTSVDTLLRRTALALTTLFVCGGLLFGLGYAFEDPGGWPAVGIAAVLVVPVVGLSVLAAKRPQVAVPVLLGGVGLFAVWGVVGLMVDLVRAPDIPAIALVLALPIALVGQHEPLKAAGLLLATAAVPVLLIVVRLFTESADVMGADAGGEPGGGRPGVAALLGTSTGAVILPLVVLGALFLGAAAMERTPAHHA